MADDSKVQKLVIEIDPKTLEYKMDFQANKELAIDVLREIAKKLENNEILPDDESIPAIQ